MSIYDPQRIGLGVVLVEGVMSNFSKFLLVLAIVLIPIGSAIHDYGICHILAIISFSVFIYIAITNKKCKHKKDDI